jgi:hypothetical protein
MSAGRKPLLDPRLRYELDRAPQDRLRRIALAAAAAAVDSVSDRPVALDHALASAQSGTVDSSTAASLDDLVTELDDIYLSFASETPGETDGARESAFRVARAAAALAFAVSPDPVLAASESLYEAVHALGGNVEAVVEITRRTT